MLYMCICECVALFAITLQFSGANFELFVDIKLVREGKRLKMWMRKVTFRTQ